MDATELAEVIEERATQLMADVGGDAMARADRADTAECLHVLRRVVQGKPVAEAFGTPGRWGYETPIGAALAARGEDSGGTRHAVSELKGDEGELGGGETGILMEDGRAVSEVVAEMLATRKGPWPGLPWYASNDFVWPEEPMGEFEGLCIADCSDVPGRNGEVVALLLAASPQLFKQLAMARAWIEARDPEAELLGHIDVALRLALEGEEG